MIIITAGMIKTFEECPIKYNLIYEKHLEIPSNDEYAEKGKKLHALINYYIKGYDIKNLIKSLENDENKELYKLWNTFLSLDINMCEESEFSFSVPFDENIKIAGRTDAIRKIGNKYEILDWKTGKSENINPENDWQSVVYLFGLYELFYYNKKIKNYDDLSMTYCFLNENIKKTVNFSKETYENYKEKLSEIIKKISQSQDISIKNTNSCSKCSFNIICQRAYIR